MSGFGFGFGFIKPSSAGYTFQNSQAETYWNALTTANGSELDGSNYSISRNALKQAIDNFFVTGNTSGWLSNMKGMYLYIGATANTHAVNAINPGTFNLTFVNSPTHSASGIGALNGTTQYVRTGIIDSVDMTLNDSHIAAKSATNSGGAFKYYGGALVSGTQRNTLFYHPTNLRNTSHCYNTVAAQGLVEGTTNSTQGNVIISRISNVRADIYYNGTSEGNSTGTGGTQPDIEFYLGALNNAGSPGTYSDWLFKYHSIGSGLSSAKVTSLNTAINTLQTALNR